VKEKERRPREWRSVGSERERERERGVELTGSSVGSRWFFVERGVYQRRGSACRKDGRKEGRT